MMFIAFFMSKRHEQNSPTENFARPLLVSVFCLNQTNPNLICEDIILKLLRKPHETHLKKNQGCLAMKRHINKPRLFSDIIFFPDLFHPPKKYTEVRCDHIGTARIRIASLVRADLRLLSRGEFLVDVHSDCRFFV